MKIGNVNVVYANTRVYEFGVYCLKGIIGIISTAILILCFRAVLKIELPMREEKAVISNVPGNRINDENFKPENWADILNVRLKEGLMPFEIPASIPVKKAEAYTEIKPDDPKEEAVSESVLVSEDKSENMPKPMLSFKGNLGAAYCVGSEVNTSGLEIYLGEESIPLTDWEIGSTDTSTAGEKVVTVGYNGLSVDIPYSVAEYTAVLDGNGGRISQTTASLWNYMLDESTVEIPRKLGKKFDGWYRNPECTVPFEEALEGETTVRLYAGFSDFGHFVCNDEGYITTYTGTADSITDTTLNIPKHPDCTGIESGAFDMIGEGVFEMYIPANITYINPAVFDSFTNLMFIYVEPSNPVYMSDGTGCLYRKDGMELVLCPAGQSL